MLRKKRGEGVLSWSYERNIGGAFREEGETGQKKIHLRSCEVQKWIPMNLFFQKYM